MRQPSAIRHPHPPPAHTLAIRRYSKWSRGKTRAASVAVYAGPGRRGRVEIARTVSASAIFPLFSVQLPSLAR